MEHQGLIELAVVTGLISYSIHAASKRRKRAADALAHLGDLLEGSHDVANGFARGHHDGVALVHRLTTRGEGSSRTQWTEIECELRAYRLALHVEAHGWRDAARIARGEMVDVELGDAAFDTRFRVEGAPAAVVQRLFDAPTRAFLCSLRAVEVDVVDGERRVLRIAIAGWIQDPTIAQAAWTALAAIRTNLTTAYEAVEAELPVSAVGSPFRPEPDASAQHALHERQLDEIAQLERLREARAAADRRRHRGWSVVLVLGFVIAMALSLR